MKRILVSTLLLLAGFFSLLNSQAQTFPVQNLQIRGTGTMPTPPVGTNDTTLATMAAIAQHNTPCQSILDYGGKNDGVNFNDAAFAAAIAAQPPFSTCIYFPQGTYLFNSQQTINTTASQTVS